MTVQDETGNVAAASTSPSPLAQLMELATKLEGRSSTSTSATTSPTTDVPMGVQTVVTTDTIPPIKKGVVTSEFLLTLAADVAATVLLLTHNISSTQWTSVTGGTAAVYAVARTWLKG